MCRVAGGGAVEDRCRAVAGSTRDRVGQRASSLMVGVVCGYGWGTVTLAWLDGEPSSAGFHTLAGAEGIELFGSELWERAGQGCVVIREVRCSRTQVTA
eukprot:6329308-Prymnesium_polylepis.1